jgi:hypothetical protein
LVGKPHDAVKAFDPYEVIGIITPGIVVALMLTMEWPSFRTLLSEKGLSIGDFGLFVLVAFVLGHLIQAVGNLIEPIIWFPSGLPTNWVRSTSQSLVTPEQRNALGAAVAKMEGTAQDISKISRSQWLAVTTRAYGRLRMAGRSGRVDFANRTYGLSRGLSAALLACLAWYAVAHRHDFVALLILAAALGAAVSRTRRAGIYYARALVLEFITLTGGTRQPVCGSVVSGTREARRPRESTPVAGEKATWGSPLRAKSCPLERLPGADPRTTLGSRRSIERSGS